MGRLVDSDDLVGCAEIAHRLGYQGAETVHNWRRRFANSFPSPIARLNIGLIFAWPDVRRWAEDNRRDLRVADFDEPMFTAAEAAKRLGVRESSIYRWIADGRVAATPRPARLRVTDVEALVERVRQNPRRPFANP